MILPELVKVGTCHVREFELVPQILDDYREAQCDSRSLDCLLVESQFLCKEVNVECCLWANEWRILSGADDALNMVQNGVHLILLSNG